MLRRTLRVVAALLVVVAIAGAVTWQFFPRALVATLGRVQRAQLGFAQHELATPVGTFAYLEGGSGEPMVLLHGFGADKGSWLYIAPKLAERYRVIIPDLPGHGDTRVDAKGDYRPMTQATRVRAFLRALNAGPVHLAGWSMGGHVAGHVAHDAPEALRSLALIVSGGIATDSSTPRGRELREGVRALSASSMAELDDILVNVLELPDGSVPGFFKRGILSDAARRRAHSDSIQRQMLEPGSVSSLDSVAPGIRVPTIVLWGEQDVLLHVAMGRRLAERIPGARFVADPNCGHACVISRTDATAAAWLQFLDSLAARGTP